VSQRHLPDELGDATFYQPGGFGFEKRVAERMAWWAARRDAAGPADGAGD
jgi:putative ATPase